MTQSLEKRYNESWVYVQSKAEDYTVESRIFNKHSHTSFFLALNSSASAPWLASSQAILSLIASSIVFLSSSLILAPNFSLSFN